jgi:hypothetical protein
LGFNASASCWFLTWPILPPRRCRRYVPPKRRLTFKGLQVVISQKIELFIQIMFKKLVPTSNKALHFHYKHQPATCCIGREVANAYCKNHRKYTNAACIISDC